MTMRIAVFGAGGVGGYFGGRLAEAGEDVAFIARGRHLHALKAKGLRVDSIAGDFALTSVQATDDPREIGPVDIVLVGVKAWQVAEAASAMRPLLGVETCVVPLQNGVEAPARLAAELGPERVLGGLCSLIVFTAGPGHLCHAGGEPRIEFGELDNSASERTRRLLNAFARAKGLTAEIPTDIHAALWEKFLFIAPWSGVGAVTRAPIGILRSQPESRRVLEQAMQEVEQVGRARGIALPPGVLSRTITLLEAMPADGTTSMQRDIMSGHPSELDTQNGAVVWLGRETGVETPVNTLIYRCLLPLELRARGQLQFE